MRLSIAGLHIDVAADSAVLEALPNLRPFVVSGSDDDSCICNVLTGQQVTSEETPSTLSSQSDDKAIQVWLKPDTCKLSLYNARSGQTYWLQTDRQWQKVLTDWTPSDAESLASLNDLIMIAFVYRSAFYQAVTIHASAIAVKNEGCAFVGPSGIGKSTHSRLWLQHVPDSRLLNDDQPVLRQLPDGTVRLYGSPWSGKTSCYCNEGVALKALFFMEQALENQLTRLTGIETFQKLMKFTSLMGRDTVTFRAISSTQASISGAIPAYLFRNFPTKEAVMFSHKAFADIVL
jgi:hypothetical protein